MPLPKRKHSRARRDKRRSANSKIAIPSFAVCPQCGKPKLPHRVCRICGYYKGKPVIVVKEKAKEDKKK